MSRLRTSFLLGYHGCDQEVAEKLLSGEEDFKPSEKDYDWLGPGAYFWEGDAKRAWEWAENRPKSRRFKRPYVVGAVIDPGNCLDLTTRGDLELLADAYQSFKAGQEKAGMALPENKDLKDGRPDKLMRHLDCAVIRHLHDNIEQGLAEAHAANKEPAFERLDTGGEEGEEAYPGAGFRQLTHTQVAVRNMGCIKGVFRVRP